MLVQKYTSQDIEKRLETSKGILEVPFKRNISAINMKCLTELGSYFVFGMLYTRITLGPILCCF